MTTHTIHSAGQTFARVSKAYARTHYQTQPIAICPVNLRPGFPLAPHMMLTQETYEPVWEGDDRGTFDGQVRNFEYYNCCDSETGRYAAFYLVK